MTGRGAARRAELCLAAVGVTSVLLAAVVLLDAVRFHLPALLRGEVTLDAHTVVLLVLCVAEAVVLVRVARSLARQRRIARRIRLLRSGESVTIAGHRVTVVVDPLPLAFCSGLLRPRVYLSDAALACLGPRQLRAVVEHEAEHARRRDPLRMALAHTLADGFAFVPGLQRLAARQATAADLIADATVVADTGSVQPLAAAMLVLHDPAPERVDQLLGRPARTLPRPLLACAVVSAAGLAALTVLLATSTSDPALPGAAIVGLAVPAWLAARRPA